MDLPRGTSPTSESSRTSQQPDYATWLTKQQAADAIGVSTKTIETFAKDRKIQQTVYRPENRGPAKAVYNPDDVARIASERRPGLPAFVLPAVRPTNGNGGGGLAHPTAQPPADDTRLAMATGLADFAAALRTLMSEKLTPSENSEKLFLTLDEAAAVSGLSVTYLKRAVNSGSIPAVKDGRRWRVRRRDLECL